LWEQLLARENLAEALRRVEQKAGAPGIDGMSTKELRPWLKDHWPEVRSQLDAGTYRPQPVRRVMIPKPSGGMRKLGVPAVVDRLICQAIAQVLTPIFDPNFHPHSFGFRPGRSQHHAVERARQFIADDAAWCVDFDLGVATSGRVPGWVEAPLVLLDVEFPVGVEVAREVDSAEA
jgi:retron-type reverse transcriptase